MKSRSNLQMTLMGGENLYESHICSAFAEKHTRAEPQAKADTIYNVTFNVNKCI